LLDGRAKDSGLFLGDRANYYRIEEALEDRRAIELSRYLRGENL